MLMLKKLWVEEPTEIGEFRFFLVVVPFINDLIFTQISYYVRVQAWRLWAIFHTQSMA